MNSIIVSAMVATALFGITSAGCPPAPACMMALKPGFTFAPATMDYNGETCNFCGRFVADDAYTDANGCPTAACTNQYMKPECKREVTIEWNGKQCRWCPVEIC